MAVLHRRPQRGPQVRVLRREEPGGQPRLQLSRSAEGGGVERGDQHRAVEVEIVKQPDHLLDGLLAATVVAGIAGKVLDLDVESDAATQLRQHLVQRRDPRALVVSRTGVVATNVVEVSSCTFAEPPAVERGGSRAER